MKRRTFVGVAGIGLLGLGGCVGTRTEADPDADASDDERSTDERDREADDDDEKEEDAPSEETIGVGELVEGDEVRFVVTGVDRRSSFDGLVLEEDRPTAGTDDERRRASDGHEFILVDLAVQNATDDAFVTLPQAFRPALRDDDEQEYAQAPSTSGDALSGGVLAPGEVERGELAYEVSDGRSVSALTLGPDATDSLGTDGLVVDLADEADEDVTLEQELRVPVHEFGTTVERDGITIGVDRMGLGNNLGPFFEPEDDHEYVVVGVTITNDTGEERTFSVPEGVQLKDETGWSYPEDHDALSPLERFDESTRLRDGESQDGTLAYHVEQGRDRLYWSVEVPQWTEEKVFWQLR